MIGWSIFIVFLTSFFTMWWQMERSPRKETKLGLISGFVCVASIVVGYVYGMSILLTPSPPPETVTLKTENWSCSHQRFVPYHTENGGKTHIPDGYICDQWMLK